MSFLKIAGTEVRVVPLTREQRAEIDAIPGDRDTYGYIPTTPPPVWWAKHIAGCLWTLPSVLRICDLWNPEGGHRSRCDFPPLTIIILATGLMHSEGR